MTRYTLDSEVLLLQKYAEKAIRGIVEIGVLDGNTTAEMAKVAHVMIYGIDPIIPDSMSSDIIGNEQSIITNMSFYPHFLFIKDYSYSVVKTFQYQFDFLFIDGSHAYEDVRRDFDEWTMLLAPRGYVALHDSAPTEPSSPVWFGGWPGPAQLVNEIMCSSKFLHIERRDTINVFKKL